MVVHPECMRKAQEELDRVVGSDRLPEYSDRASLPYIEGILQETLRFVFLIFFIHAGLYPLAGSLL